MKSVIFFELSIICSGQYVQQQTYTSIENGTYSPNHYGQTTMRKYLIKTRGHQCEDCKNTLWKDKPINLTVEHIDGNWKNNKLNNVQLLCWNCHSMTPTFCGKRRCGTRTKRTLIYQKGKKLLNEN